MNLLDLVNLVLKLAKVRNAGWLAVAEFVAAVPSMPVQRLIHTPRPSQLTRVTKSEPHQVKLNC